MPTVTQKLLLATVLLVLGSGCSRYAIDMLRENKLTPRPLETPLHHPKPGQWRDDAITVSWLGHATALINLFGSWIITDPALLQRIGPPETFDNAFGIRRIMALPLALDELAEIETVLISHAHYDHLDLPSLRRLAPDRPTIIVPRGVAPLLEGIDAPVVELDWRPGNRRQMQFDDGLQIRAFRVEHYGFVPGTRRSRPSGVNGYLIEKRGKRIAFFGDTSFDRNRDENGLPLAMPQTIDWSEKSPLNEQAIDLCLLPIGDSHFHFNHISPKEAVKIATATRCRKILPIHYGTFILTPDKYRLPDPAGELVREMKKSNSAAKSFCLHDPPTNATGSVGKACRLGKK